MTFYYQTSWEFFKEYKEYGHVQLSIFCPHSMEISIYFFFQKDTVMKQFSYDFEVDFGAISEESFPKISSIGFAFGPGYFKNTSNTGLISLWTQSKAYIVLSFSSQNLVFHHLFASSHEDVKIISFIM